MTVTVAGQSNNPPRAFNYADTYGQRTVEAIFLLIGESLETFSTSKQSAFEQILFRALDNDPTVSIQDDAVHICNVTSLTSSVLGTSSSSSPSSSIMAPTASKSISADEVCM